MTIIEAIKSGYEFKSNGFACHIWMSLNHDH